MDIEKTNEIVGPGLYARQVQELLNTWVVVRATTANSVVAVDGDPTMSKPAPAFGGVRANVRVTDDREPNASGRTTARSVEGRRSPSRIASHCSTHSDTVSGTGHGSGRSTVAGIVSSTARFRTLSFASWSRLVVAWRIARRPSDSRSAAIQAPSARRWSLSKLLVRLAAWLCPHNLDGSAGPLFPRSAD